MLRARTERPHLWKRSNEIKVFYLWRAYRNECRGGKGEVPRVRSPAFRSFLAGWPGRVWRGVAWRGVGWAAFWRRGNLQRAWITPIITRDNRVTHPREFGVVRSARATWAAVALPARQHLGGVNYLQHFTICCMAITAAAAIYHNLLHFSRFDRRDSRIFVITIWQGNLSRSQFPASIAFPILPISSPTYYFLPLLAPLNLYQSSINIVQGQCLPVGLPSCRLFRHRSEHVTLFFWQPASSGFLQISHCLGAIGQAGSKPLQSRQGW